MSDFHWPVRVYYEDTDGGGVVYHANYIKFMERARSEWLRSLGFEQSELKMIMGIIFVVRSIAIQYRRPARFDNVLDVMTTLVRTGRSLLVFEQTISCEKVALTQATVEIVCVDATTFKPASIPEPIRTVLQKI